MPIPGCKEVREGEVKPVTLFGHTDSSPKEIEFTQVGLDWVFPSILQVARSATLHPTAQAAFRNYQRGHMNRPQHPSRQAVEIRVTMRGLDLRNINLSRADQIRAALEAETPHLRRELGEIRAMGGQGALLPAPGEGTTVILLKEFFHQCVEFRDAVIFEPDELIP